MVTLIVTRQSKLHDTLNEEQYLWIIKSGKNGRKIIVSTFTDGTVNNSDLSVTQFICNEAL